MRITTMTGLRRSCALALSAAGFASVAALAAPASASAATPASASGVSAHQAHLNHVNHVNHASQTSSAAPAVQAASRSAARTEPAPMATAVDKSPRGVRALARTMVPAGQWYAFDQIISHESSWNYRAVNPSSGAYGLPQALPGWKMASVASDWRTNPVTQIKWGLRYMNTRYGSPTAAWAWWRVHHWY